MVDVARRIEDLKRELASNRASRQFYQLGELLRREGRSAEAADVLRSGLANHPRYVAAWVALGRACVDGGQAEEAITALREALALDAANPVAWRLLGEAHLALGDRRTALEVLQHCLELVPGDEVLQAAVDALAGETPAPGTQGVTRPSPAPSQPAELFVPAAAPLGVALEGASAGAALAPQGVTRAAEALPPVSAPWPEAAPPSPFEVSSLPPPPGDVFSLEPLPITLPGHAELGSPFAPPAPLAALTAAFGAPLPAVGGRPESVGTDLGEPSAESVTAAAIETTSAADTAEVAAPPTIEPAAPPSFAQAPPVEAEEKAGVAAPASAAPRIEAVLPAAPPAASVAPQHPALAAAAPAPAAALGAAPAQPRPTVALARLHVQQQDLSGAVRVLEQVLERQPSNVEARELLALVRDMMEPLDEPLPPLSLRERKIAALQRWLACLTLGQERAVS